ncbi:MAG: electron transfer flavoprotein subunit beta/FixA family protein [Erysipelotrichaceae bacterium]
MKIIVCIKQVPDTQKVQVDPVTGVLNRNGIETKMNPYDLYAIETALYIKQKTNAHISVITMGPPSATEIIHEAFSLGCDEGYLLTDRKFAGADVLATSFAISQGILSIDKEVDLIICGKQTTDGDTAQVGPAIGEHLSIPHVSWVKKIIDVDEHQITLNQEYAHSIATTRLTYPCLLTVEDGIFQPRLPSYTLKQESKDKSIHTITFNDLVIQEESRYGLSGSPTQVEKIFEPVSNDQTTKYVGDSKKLSNQLYQTLVDLKYVEGQ